MDFNRAEKNLYLTMRVSAIEIVEREMLFNDLYMEQLNQSRHSSEYSHENYNEEEKFGKFEERERLKTLDNIQNFLEFDSTTEGFKQKY